MQSTRAQVSRGNAGTLNYVAALVRLLRAIRVGATLTGSAMIEEMEPLVSPHAAGGRRAVRGGRRRGQPEADAALALACAGSDVSDQSWAGEIIGDPKFSVPLSRFPE